MKQRVRETINCQFNLTNMAFPGLDVKWGGLVKKHTTISPVTFLKGRWVQNWHWNLTQNEKFEPNMKKKVQFDHQAAIIQIAASLNLTCCFLYKIHISRYLGIGDFFRTHSWANCNLWGWHWLLLTINTDFVFMFKGNLYDRTHGSEHGAHLEYTHVSNVLFVFHVLFTCENYMKSRCRSNLYYIQQDIRICLFFKICSCVHSRSLHAFNDTTHGVGMKWLQWKHSCFACFKHF